MTTNAWLERPEGPRRGILIGPPAALLLTLALAGCGSDGPTVPETEDPLGISYSFDGWGGGSQGVTEEPEESEGVPVLSGEWALARSDSLGGVVIASFEETGEDRGDLFILQLQGAGGSGQTTNPTVPLGRHTCTELGADGTCHGRLLVGVDLRGGGTPEAVFVVTSGTVDLLEIGTDRVRGSFQLTLTSVATPSTSIAITDGLIDLPFGRGAGPGGGVVCLARNLQEGGSEPCP